LAEESSVFSIQVFMTFLLPAMALDGAAASRYAACCPKLFCAITFSLYMISSQTFNHGDTEKIESF